MLALVWGSASSSANDGEPGNSSQDGKQFGGRTATSAGQKPSALNCSYALLTPSSLRGEIFLSMETTQASLKAGGTAIIATTRPTMYSNEFIPSSLKPLVSLTSTPNTYRVLQTQLTDPPGVSSPTGTSSFHVSPSLPLLSCSSLTSSTSQTANLTNLTPLSLLAVPTTPHDAAKPRNEPRRNSSMKMTSSTSPSHKLLLEPRFNSPLSDTISSITTLSSCSTPHPYNPSLNPKPSLLRPHCFAKDCLHMWTPSLPSTRSPPAPSTQSNLDDTPNILDNQLNRILDVISASWTEKTKETYGSGLLIFHVFCDLNNIPEDHCCPASSSLIASFVASCAGAYSGSALSNSIAGLHAWHLLHGQPWNINQNELHSILEGASRLAPASSKRPKCILVERDLLLQFLTYFNLDDLGDAAIFACIVVTFYSVSHLGEFTVPAISKFRPSQHITCANYTKALDHNDTIILSFIFPQ
jgi:hypothetical protein